jgi:hypothetical protein
MAAIVIDVPCSGEMHQIELRDDGTAVMLVHDEAIVRACVVFGARPPECLAALDEAREYPVDFVLANVEMADKVKGLLACDFAEHVLHIFEAEVPDDDRPRKAIHTARAYWRGKATREQLDEARVEAKAAWNRSADAARFAAGAALATPTARARWAAWDAAHAKAEGAADAAAYVAAMAAESLWQLSRIFKVLDAVRKGKRWPRLS